ncbi:DAGAT-domain-containing protein [Ascodesmis nigricans]|uniref:diacylglycerol O-acyltransferase n=1 Tax=Ascodesmis nigricans TaxID=341454 RepID=A0A4V3SIB1_9PEZI|nr:DAGAT-domain-containing protein [Ascodesmis nigricans]
MSSSRAAKPHRAAAIPPNLKTGVSYADAADAPPLDMTPEPGKSYASAAQSPKHKSRSKKEKRRSKAPPASNPVETRPRPSSLEEEDDYDDYDGGLDGSTTERISGPPTPPNNTPRQLSPESLRRVSQEKEKGVKPLTSTEKGKDIDKSQHSPVFKEGEEGLTGYESGTSGEEKGLIDYTLGGTMVLPDVPALVSHTFSKDISWAPLHVPLERRLQTIMVIWFTLAISLCFSLFWFLLAIPLTWPLLLPYLLYVFLSTSHLDGSSPFRRSHLFRSLPIWKHYTNYFPLRLHRTVPLDPTKNYIFAYHPHGIISHGAFGNFATEATGFSKLFPGITNTLLTLDSNFRIPFYRDYLLALGLASVSRKSCESILRGKGEPRSHRLLRRILPAGWAPNPPSEGGRAITIVIGGARESLEAFPGRMRLVVKRRRGFLKIAMRERVGVVPVLAFGENDLYNQLVPTSTSLLSKLQSAVKKTMGFALPLIHARGIFNYDVGLLPYRKPVNTVVGKPMFWEGEEITEEEVDVFQRRYIEELERMWEEHKETFASERVKGEEGELVIIE